MPASLPEPKTASQLFDYLNEAFGVGHYDEIAHAEPPWFKVRMSEIGKLKKILTSRRTDVREVYITGEYCRAHGISLLASQDIFRHIPAAMKAWRQDMARVQRATDASAVQTAIEQAYAAGDIAFAERMLLADRATQQRLAREWRAR